MNRRELFLSGAAVALAPSTPAFAELEYLGDNMFRASLSDGRRVTCYQGIGVLMTRLREMCVPQMRDGYVWRVDPHIRLIERYDREACRWVFYAGSRA